MRYIVTLGAGCLVALLIVGGALQGQEQSGVNWARRDAEIARIARQAALEEATQPVHTLLAMLWPLVGFGAGLGALVYIGGLGAAHVRRLWYERKPDHRGLLPVRFEQLPQVSADALGFYHLTALEEARRPMVQQVPDVINFSPHFAPHVNYRGEAAPSASPNQAPSESEAAPLPGLTEFGALGFAPSAGAILLGLGEGGQKLTVSVKALCHVALVGATGGGKSNLLRLLLPQLQAIGARVVLADPHFAPFDSESGEDWRPIAGRLHMAPAVSPDEIGQLLEYLGGELDRRLAQRREGLPPAGALFLALDELPVIADTVPGAMDSLGRLLREGRKVGLYTVGASQSMLVKVLGGDSSAREAYRTAYYVGGDMRSAAAILDMPQRAIDEGAVGAGVSYLRSVATAPAQLVRVPYMSNAALVTLLGPPSPAPSPAPSGAGWSSRAAPPAEGQAEGALEVGAALPLPAHHNGPKWTPQEAGIIEALKAGQTVGEVATALAGAKGGRKYQEAARLVGEVVRRAL